MKVGGARSWYHGDYDWDGIDIANQVMTRHGAEPWRMTEAQYRAAARPDEESIPLTGRACPTDWEPGLSAAMKQTGVVVFEEAVTDELIDALRR